MTGPQVDTHNALARQRGQDLTAEWALEDLIARRHLEPERPGWFARFRQAVNDLLRPGEMP